MLPEFGGVHAANISAAGAASAMNLKVFFIFRFLKPCSARTIARGRGNLVQRPAALQDWNISAQPIPAASRNSSSDSHSSSASDSAA